MNYFSRSIFGIEIITRNSNDLEGFNLKGSIDMLVVN